MSIIIEPAIEVNAFRVVDKIFVLFLRRRFPPIVVRPRKESRRGSCDTEFSKIRDPVMDCKNEGAYEPSK